MQKLARPKQKKQARDLCVSLKNSYKPFFIRRTKRETFKTISSELSEHPLQWNELPFKTDLVVWIPLSDLQKTIYAQIVNSATVKHTIKGHDKKHIFVIIQALKQLCVHPMILLNKIYKEVKGGEGDKE